MDFGASVWAIPLTIGVVVLGAAIAYGIMRNRKVTPREHAQTERKTAELYDAEQRDPAN